VEALQGPPTSKLPVGLKAVQAEAGYDVLTRAQVAMDDQRMLEKVATDPVVGTSVPHGPSGPVLAYDWTGPRIAVQSAPRTTTDCNI
jgi:hypothetical protein